MPGLLVAVSLSPTTHQDWGDLVGLAEASGDFLHIESGQRTGDGGREWTRLAHVVRQVRQMTDLPIDVHIMGQGRATPAADLRQAGADLLTVEWRAGGETERFLDAAQTAGVLAGVSLGRMAVWEELTPIWRQLDVVLVTGGSVVATLCAVEQVRALRGDRDRPLIQVQGCAIPDAISRLRAAGADLVVVKPRRGRSLAALLANLPRT
ncbi:MAG: hypothetical protein M0Z53_11125 [Thermaerobacter sp.]|nr:hypothetical protein [Thermaerobacter sp.]